MNPQQKNRILAAALPFGLALAAFAPVAALGTAAAVAPRAAFAEDEEGDKTTAEAAKASRLLPALSLPAGAQRVTSKGDIATLKTQLVKMVKASGGSFGVGEVEVLAWQGVEEAGGRRKSVVSSLKKQGFEYMPQKPNTSDSTTVTLFGAVNEVKSQGLIGFWMEGEEDGIQMLVWGRIGGTKKAEPAEDAEPAEPAGEEKPAEPATEGGEGGESGGTAGEGGGSGR